MKQDKTQFHEKMGRWESDFADFKKNVFPKNYGAMASKYLPVFLILMSIMLPFTTTRVNFILFIIKPVMFITGVVLCLKWTRNIQGNNLTTVNYLQLQKHISAAEHNYSMYPDVMEYLKKFKTSVETEQKHKKNIKRNFWIMFCGFFVIFVLYHIYNNNYRNSFSILRNEDWGDNICRVLELEQDVPFLILEPYKTNIDDSMTIESKKLSVYLGFIIAKDKEEKAPSCDVHYLTAKRPIVVGGTGNMRLTITDENGNPIPRCPCFVYDPNGGKEIINSEYFLYTSNVFDDLSDLQTLETLRYLQANKEHLRFIVEKI